MKKLWFLLLIPAALLLWWAFSGKTAIPAVHYATVRRETIASIVSTNGKLEPIEFAAARAEIAGIVTNVAIERGQHVKAGQTLVIMDNASERAALDTARAQFETAQAEQATVKQGGKLSLLTDYEGRLQAARLTQSDAERRLESIRRLYAKQASTKEEVVSSEAAVASAKQQVQAIENNRKNLVAPSDRSISEAKLQDARAALGLASHRLAQHTIKAPMAGIAYQLGKPDAQVDIRKGAYLEVGALVAMIGNLDQMRVRVYVDEPDLGRISLNLPVDITWDARPGQKWHGRVTQTPTEITALNTRQVGIVTCIIDNPNDELLPGTNVDAAIVSKVVTDAISIPKQALQTTAQQTGVWKLNGDTVSWQPVTAGVSNITSVQVKSGLRTGERVVLPSDATLTNGMRVKPLAGESGT
jgi:HlyD family secretion protein